MYLEMANLKMVFILCTAQPRDENLKRVVARDVAEDAVGFLRNATLSLA